MSPGIYVIRVEDRGCAKTRRKIPDTSITSLRRSDTQGRVSPAMVTRVTEHPTSVLVLFVPTLTPAKVAFFWSPELRFRRCFGPIRGGFRFVRHMSPGGYVVVDDFVVHAIAQFKKPVGAVVELRPPVAFAVGGIELSQSGFITDVKEPVGACFRDAYTGAWFESLCSFNIHELDLEVRQESDLR